MALAHQSSFLFGVTSTAIASTSFVQVVPIPERVELGDPELLPFVEHRDVALLEHIEDEVFFSMSSHGTMQVVTVSSTSLIPVESEATLGTLYSLSHVALAVELVGDAVDARHVD